ncbi:MAG: ABC-three component system middle component 6 [Candidatus Nitrotoga sp.]
MILPTKHISLDQSLLGAGAVMLPILFEPMTTTGIWERIKHAPEIGTYGRFVLTLDFLYAIGAIDMVEGLISRKKTP